MIFVSLGSVWDRLSLGFKVATPVLHCIFMTAQIHGSKILFSMYKRQKRELRDLRDVEQVVEQLKDKEVDDISVSPKSG
jgi:hypothetical protein